MAEYQDSLLNNSNEYEDARQNHASSTFRCESTIRRNCGRSLNARIRKISSIDQSHIETMRHIAANNERNAESLRAKENYLNRLKTIDLSQYSFPNE